MKHFLKIRNIFVHSKSKSKFEFEFLYHHENVTIFKRMLHTMYVLYIHILFKNKSYTYKKKPILVKLLRKNLHILQVLYNRMGSNQMEFC